MLRLFEDQSGVARFALGRAGQAGFEQSERQPEKQHLAIPKRAASSIRILCSKITHGSEESKNIHRFRSFCAAP
jgi:hypothetical protein